MIQITSYSLFNTVGAPLPRAAAEAFFEIASCGARPRAGWFRLVFTRMPQFQLARGVAVKASRVPSLAGFGTDGAL